MCLVPVSGRRVLALRPARTGVEAESKGGVILVNLRKPRDGPSRKQVPPSLPSRAVGTREEQGDLNRSGLKRPRGETAEPLGRGWGRWEALQLWWSLWPGRGGGDSGTMLGGAGVAAEGRGH